MVAAIELFVANGYGTTSIAAVAKHAGVAVQTVYATFGNKPTILAAALDQTIAGDDAAVDVNAREWMRDVLHAATAVDRLDAYAAGVRRIMTGAGDMFMVVASAAAVDAEVVQLAATTEARRRIGATSVINAVLEVGSLRDGLDAERAVDLLALFNSPATFHQLVRASNWSLDEYQDWLAGTLERELLAPRR